MRRRRRATREQEEERRSDKILSRLHESGMEGLSAKERSLLNRVSAVIAIGSATQRATVRHFRPSRPIQPPQPAPPCSARPEGLEFARAQAGYDLELRRGIALSRTAPAMSGPRSIAPIVGQRPAIRKPGRSGRSAHRCASC